MSDFKVTFGSLGSKNEKEWGEGYGTNYVMVVSVSVLCRVYACGVGFESNFFDCRRITRERFHIQKDPRLEKLCRGSNRIALTWPRLFQSRKSSQTKRVRTNLDTSSPYLYQRSKILARQTDFRLPVKLNYLPSQDQQTRYH